jgi:hypothetical protein
MPRQQRFHARMAAVAIAAGVAQVLLGSAGIQRYASTQGAAGDSSADRR